MMLELAGGGNCDFVEMVRLFFQMTVDVFAVSYPYNDHKEFPIEDLVNDAIFSRTDAIKFFLRIEQLAIGGAGIDCQCLYVRDQLSLDFFGVSCDKIAGP